MARVPEDGMSHSCIDGLNHGRWRSELHVCHPHGQELLGHCRRGLVSEQVFGITLKCQRVGAAPVNYPVEIVTHHTTAMRTSSDYSLAASPNLADRLGLFKQQANVGERVAIDNKEVGECARCYSAELA